MNIRDNDNFSSHEHLCSQTEEMADRPQYPDDLNEELVLDRSRQLHSPECISEYDYNVKPSRSYPDSVQLVRRRYRHCPRNILEYHYDMKPSRPYPDSLQLVTPHQQHRPRYVSEYHINARLSQSHRDLLEPDNADRSHRSRDLLPRLSGSMQLFGGDLNRTYPSGLASSKKLTSICLPNLPYPEYPITYTQSPLHRSQHLSEQHVTPLVTWSPDTSRRRHDSLSYGHRIPLGYTARGLHSMNTLPVEETEFRRNLIESVRHSTPKHRTSSPLTSDPSFRDHRISSSEQSLSLQYRLPKLLRSTSEEFRVRYSQKTDPGEFQHLVSSETKQEPDTSRASFNDYLAAFGDAYIPDSVSDTSSGSCFSDYVDQLDPPSADELQSHFLNRIWHTAFYQRNELRQILSTIRPEMPSIERGLFEEQVLHADARNVDISRRNRDASNHEANESSGYTVTPRERTGVRSRLFENSERSIPSRHTSLSSIVSLSPVQSFRDHRISGFERSSSSQYRLPRLLRSTSEEYRVHLPQTRDTMSDPGELQHLISSDATLETDSSRTLFDNYLAAFGNAYIPDSVSDSSSGSCLSSYVDQLNPRSADEIQYHFLNRIWHTAFYQRNDLCQSFLAIRPEMPSVDRCLFQKQIIPPVDISRQSRDSLSHAPAASSGYTAPREVRTGFRRRLFESSGRDTPSPYRTSSLSSIVSLSPVPSFRDHCISRSDESSSSRYLLPWVSDTTRRSREAWNHDPSASTRYTTTPRKRLGIRRPLFGGTCKSIPSRHRTSSLRSTISLSPVPSFRDHRILSFEQSSSSQYRLPRTLRRTSEEYMVRVSQTRDTMSDPGELQHLISSDAKQEPDISRASFDNYLAAFGEAYIPASVSDSSNGSCFSDYVDQINTPSANEIQSRSLNRIWHTAFYQRNDLRQSFSAIRPEMPSVDRCLFQKQIIPPVDISGRGRDSLIHEPTASSGYTTAPRERRTGFHRRHFENSQRSMSLLHTTSLNSIFSLLPVPSFRYHRISSFEQSSSSQYGLPRPLRSTSDEYRVRNSQKINTISDPEIFQYQVSSGTTQEPDTSRASSDNASLVAFGDAYIPDLVNDSLKGSFFSDYIDQVNPTSADEIQSHFLNRIWHTAFYQRSYLRQCFSAIRPEIPSVEQCLFEEQVLPPDAQHVDISTRSRDFFSHEPTTSSGCTTSLRERRTGVRRHPFERSERGTPSPYRTSSLSSILSLSPVQSFRDHRISRYDESSSSRYLLPSVSDIRRRSREAWNHEPRSSSRYTTLRKRLGIRRPLFGRTCKSIPSRHTTSSLRGIVSLSPVPSLRYHRISSFEQSSSSQYILPRPLRSTSEEYRVRVPQTRDTMSDPGEFEHLVSSETKQEPGTSRASFNDYLAAFGDAYIPASVSDTSSGSCFSDYVDQLNPPSADEIQSHFLNKIWHTAFYQRNGLRQTFLAIRPEMPSVERCLFEEQVLYADARNVDVSRRNRDASNHEASESLGYTVTPRERRTGVRSRLFENTERSIPSRHTSSLSSIVSLSPVPSFRDHRISGFERSSSSQYRLPRLLRSTSEEYIVRVPQTRNTMSDPGELQHLISSDATLEPDSSRTLFDNYLAAFGDANIPDSASDSSSGSCFSGYVDQLNPRSADEIQYHFLNRIWHTAFYQRNDLRQCFLAIRPEMPSVDRCLFQNQIIPPVDISRQSRDSLSHEPTASSGYMDNTDRKKKRVSSSSL